MRISNAFLTLKIAAVHALIWLLSPSESVRAYPKNTQWVDWSLDCLALNPREQIYQGVVMNRRVERSQTQWLLVDLWDRKRKETWFKRVQDNQPPLLDHHTYLCQHCAHETSLIVNGPHQETTSVPMGGKQLRGEPSKDGFRGVRIQNLSPVWMREVSS